MITWLQYSKTSNFYRRVRPLTKAAIERAFVAIRKGVKKPHSSIFNHIHEPAGEATWSATAFFHEREPAFLKLPPGHMWERVCGFILLVEYKQHVAVFKSGIDLPVDFRSRHLRPVGVEKIESATARASATFQQIRLRNMSASKYAMRTKTLEADDLPSVISPSGASRYAPAGFRTLENDVHYTATPRSGRISTRSDRVGFSELTEWAKEVIDRLLQKNIELSPFIRTFGRPLDLASQSASLTPNVVAVDVAAITEAQYGEPGSIRLLRKEESGMTRLTRPEADVVLAALARAFEVRRVRKEFRLVDSQSSEVIGEIRVGKTRISLWRFDLPEASDIYVEQTETPGEPDPLKRYIDQNDLFTVLFDKLDVVYLEGSLYRDPALAEGGQMLLSYLKGEPRLASTTSEKGKFSSAHKTFDQDSVFNVVIQTLAASDEVIVCDDLGHELADFIGVAAVAQTKTVTFYHAKHGELSLGATPFHISVSQAIKNLRYLRITVDDVEGRRDKWAAMYRNGNEETQIPRVVKGSFNLLREKVQDTVISPDTIRRVVIVTDSLSRGKVEEALKDAKEGKALPVHFVQLYGLLMGLFSACAEVGVYPTIICQP